MPFLAVLELMSGGDLGKYLRQYAKVGLPVSQLTGAGVQLADALCYLKAMGVLHRDLAARNVLVGDSLAVVKLADFGMSRDVEEKSYYKQTSQDRVPVKVNQTIIIKIKRRQTMK